MLDRMRARTNGFTLTAGQFEKVAFFAFASLTLIVASGAAVRLSSSGLGCPDWPRCYGKPYPPLDAHSIVEFGNRVVSAVVTIGVFAAAIGAHRRRPYRCDLAVLAWLLPLGALGQAVLGAFTVKSDLAYGWVMAHFGLSMAITVAGLALVWRSRHEPGSRPPAADRTVLWSIRALVVLTACAVFSGMAATAAGPHAGGAPGAVARFQPHGTDSLSWVVHRHGRVCDLLGIAVIAVLALLWRRRAPRELVVKMSVLAALVGVQGLIGSVQWREQLPPALVWLHVGFATLSWIAVLWLCFSAGVAPRGERRRVRERRPAARTAVAPVTTGSR